MKKIIILLIYVIIFSSISSQTLTVKFTGQAAGGIQPEYLYQQLDSIKITNITRNWEEWLYFPDTVMQINVVDAPLIAVANSGLSQNIPNPFDCITNADLHLTSSSNVSITVTDATGRVYLQFNDYLTAGTHRFSITLAKPQTYFLNATTSNENSSIKMVNLGSCGTNAISLQSSSNQQEISKNYQINKSFPTNAHINRLFEYGDQMEYLGYTTYNNIVFTTTDTRSQEESETVTLNFNIPFCQRSLNIDYRHSCRNFVWEHNNVTYYETNHNAAHATLRSAGGCDSVVLLDVTIYPGEIYDTISVCQTFSWYGETISPSDLVSGSISRNKVIPGFELDPNNTCDAVRVYATFIAAEPPRREFTVTQCQPYYWNNQYYYHSGTYTQTIPNEGCDSIVTLYLHSVDSVPSDTGAFDTSACGSYQWNGQTYYTSGTYSQTFTNRYGCDSVVTINLTINQPIHTNTFVTHCGAYEYRDTILYTSGIYTFNDATTYGCDSITILNLTITQETITDIYETACNAFTWEENGRTYTASCIDSVIYHPSEGCDSIIRLNLTIYRNSTNEISVTACDRYTWENTNYNTSGSYTKTLYTSYGCDSVVTLHLTINNSSDTTISKVACSEFTWEDTTYTESDVYRKILQTTNGCDSVVTLHLTINNPVVHEITDTACISYNWNDSTYTESGDYTQIFAAVNGCDSVVTLHLTINQPVAHEFFDTACIEYSWNDTIYTVSDNYTQIFTATNGCDSVVTLHLTINNPINITETITSCDSYTWNDNTYTQSGNYTFEHLDENGCTQIDTLNLTINHSYSHDTTIIACDSFEWEEETYTTSGDYSRRLQTTNGCDSILNLHLTINYSVEHEFTEVSCNSYVWNNTTYRETGDYTNTLQTVNGCDSVVTLHLSIIEGPQKEISMVACDSFEWIYGNTTIGLFTETGDYEHNIPATADETGCDSLIILHLTINQSVRNTIDTTLNCGSFVWLDGTDLVATLDTTGTYEHTFTAQNGCDSIVTINLKTNLQIIDERDNNTYCTRKYGNQVWMNENLRYLPSVSNVSTSSTVNDARYFVYGNTSTNIQTAKSKSEYLNYGVMYSFAAAQNACPSGWHLPTLDEWQELFTFLQQDSINTCGDNNSNIAKSIADNTLWGTSTEECAVGNDLSSNNKTEYNARPGGYKNTANNNSSFKGITTESNWWTSTAVDATKAVRTRINKDSATIEISTSGMRKDFSYYVRCVKDNNNNE